MKYSTLAELRILNQITETNVSEITQTLNQNFEKGLISEELCENSFKELDNLIEKAGNHKYFKREGSPGKYKYYYTEAEYKQAKGEGQKEQSDSLESSIETDSAGTHRFVSPVTGKVLLESKSGESKLDFINRIKKNTEQQESSSSEKKVGDIHEYDGKKVDNELEQSNKSEFVKVASELESKFRISAPVYKNSNGEYYIDIGGTGSIPDAPYQGYSSGGPSYLNNNNSKYLGKTLFKIVKLLDKKGFAVYKDYNNFSAKKKTIR